MCTSANLALFKLNGNLQCVPAATALQMERVHVLPRKLKTFSGPCAFLKSGAIDFRIKRKINLEKASAIYLNLINLSHNLTCFEFHVCF